MNKAAKEVKSALLMLFGRDTNAWTVAGLTVIHGKHISHHCLHVLTNQNYCFHVLIQRYLQ